MSISTNLKAVKAQLPSHVTLVAVSKTKSVATIMEAYKQGQRIFGENKVLEMAEKHDLLPKDIEWHMIGHVQRNKVKYMASFVSLIHGVDSLALLQEIDKQAQKYNRLIPCLFQIKIASETTKYGMSHDDVVELMYSETFKDLQHIKIVGVMGMATFTKDQQQIEKEFKDLKNIFDTLRNNSTKNCNLEIVSMGMSEDFPLAISCGSTMVRVGSRIFGERY